jgi:hypothetical protein
MTTHLSFVSVSLGVLLAAGAAGCASATATSSLRRTDARQGVVTRFADLKIATGTDTVVTLTDGSVVRGQLQSVSAEALSIAIEGPDRATETTRTVTEANVASVGRVVGRSKPQREWIGAGIGVLVSLPLSVSRFGDASLIGAGLGALIGRHIGDAHVEILFKRP